MLISIAYGGDWVGRYESLPGLDPGREIAQHARKR